MVILAIWFSNKNPFWEDQNKQQICCKKIRIGEKRFMIQSDEQIIVLKIEYLFTQSCFFRGSVGTLKVWKTFREPIELVFLRPKVHTEICE